MKSFLSTPSTLQFPSCNPCDPCIGHGATTSHCGWLSRNPTTTTTTTGFHIPPHPPLHFLLPDHPCTLIHTRTCACVFCADTHKYACARATHTFVRTPYKTEQGQSTPTMTDIPPSNIHTHQATLSHRQWRDPSLFTLHWSCCSRATPSFGSFSPRQPGLCRKRNLPVGESIS